MQLLFLSPYSCRLLSRGTSYSEAGLDYFQIWRGCNYSSIFTKWRKKPLSLHLQWTSFGYINWGEIRQCPNPVCSLSATLIVPGCRRIRTGRQPPGFWTLSTAKLEALQLFCHLGRYRKLSQSVGGIEFYKTYRKQSWRKHAVKKVAHERSKQAGSPIES